MIRTYEIPANDDGEPLYAMAWRCPKCGNEAEMVWGEYPGRATIAAQEREIHDGLALCDACSDEQHLREPHYVDHATQTGMYDR